MRPSLRHTVWWVRLNLHALWVLPALWVLIVLSKPPRLWSVPGEMFSLGILAVAYMHNWGQTWMDWSRWFLFVAFGVISTQMLLDRSTPWCVFQFFRAVSVDFCPAGPLTEKHADLIDSLATDGRLLIGLVTLIWLACAVGFAYLYYLGTEHKQFPDRSRLVRPFSTSKTHPLVINYLDPSDLQPFGAGNIGLTMCPGRDKARWERDLDADLAAIRSSGADVLVSLIDDREIRRMNLGRLGTATKENGMEWLHFPIRDRWVASDFHAFVRLQLQIRNRLKQVPIHSLVSVLILLGVCRGRRLLCIATGERVGRGRWRFAR